jgi:hypothetical protein
VPAASAPGGGITLGASQSPTRKSCFLTGEPGEASCEQEREGDEEPCERGLDGRLEVFGEASGSADPAECPFDDPALQHHEALDLLVVALGDGDGDRLASKAARSVTVSPEHARVGAPRAVEILRAFWRWPSRNVRRITLLSAAYRLLQYGWE